MSKILVIGGKGSIGSRYRSILDYLCVEYQVFDKEQSAFHKPGDYDADKWLICCPTELHFAYCEIAIKEGKTFLCEKPLSTKLEECKQIRDDAKKSGVLGYVVNNYAFLHRHYVSKDGLGKFQLPKWDYNYYNTGKDGKLWDACQMIYMNNKANILDCSPMWRLYCNDKLVSYLDMEKSYIEMIKAWVHNDVQGTSLWTLDDGVKMTEAVLERIERENLTSDSSTKQEQATT